MKKFLLSAFFTLLTLHLSAHTPTAGGDSDYEQTPDATFVPAMVQVIDQDIDQTITDLEEQGIIVLRHRGNILLVFVPIDYWEEDSEKAKRKLKDAFGGARIEISKPRINKPMMDQARYFNNANLIAAGEGLPNPFDGEGVVVGICDIGLDTRHPNFLSVDGKECRIRKVVHYEEKQGKRTVYETPEEIYNWRTDNEDDWHGTHVTGIAAGGYTKPVRPLFEVEEGRDPNNITLHSLAPKADIVFTGSQLSDVGLLAGVEDIIDYAKENHNPAVINLSMGNYLGPHDGSSLFSQYLDMCAEDAIICLSSGNSGGGYYNLDGKFRSDGTATSMSFDFTETAKELRVRPNDWGGTDYYGETEIWSKDATPFNFTFYLHSSSNVNNKIDIYEPLKSEDGEPADWGLSVEPESEDYDPTFAGIYKDDSYVKATAQISPLNGRYYVSLEFVLKTDVHQGNNAWAEYWAGIKLEGEPGTHVDIHTMSPLFLRQENKIGSHPMPDNKLNISDLATGFKVISVGMMNNTEVRNEPGYRKGEPDQDSGYGTLKDGRVLPITVAPGAYMYSSISSAYIGKYPDYLQYVDYDADVDGETYYWIGTTGTSMSCPFVVSGIATWLQAYPYLTSEKAIEIIRETNQKNGYPYESDPRHGQGWFNAYEGLKKVLTLEIPTGVESPDVLNIAVKVERGQLIIGNPGGQQLAINIYSPDGRPEERIRVTDTINNISLSHLSKGIHVIHIKDINGQSKTLKAIL